MSFNVGIPVLKCSLNPSQTVSAKTGKKSKTCAVDKAWNEMNDQRIGRDETIDKSMTDKNVWMEGSSQDDVIGMVQCEIDRVNAERHNAGLKSVRKDTVSVASIIEKPSMEYMKNLSYEEKIRFLNDSHKVMTDLIHGWNPNWYIFEAVQHHDEFGGISAHTHSLVMIPSVNEDGIAFFNAKREVNLKFFNYINKNYPVMMRNLGYDISDCKTYDMLSEEEKTERRLNPPKHGVSSQEYKQEHIKELAKDYQRLLTENKALKEEIVKKNTLIDKLKAEVEKYKAIAMDLKEKISSITRKAGARLMKIFGVEPPENTPEYPTREITEEIKEMQEGFKESDSRLYRVIPDLDPGKYRVVYRNNAGIYETVKGGFESRELADRFKKNIGEAARDLGAEIAKGIKNGIS
ncbi:MAG: plasmid recombination protein [Eubacteriales bacterium]|nr:plasmid recombination protein [Eubacteriales bacterium]